MQRNMFKICNGCFGYQNFEQQRHMQSYVTITAFKDIFFVSLVIYFLCLFCCQFLWIIIIIIISFFSYSFRLPPPPLSLSLYVVYLVKRLHQMWLNRSIDWSSKDEKIKTHETHEKYEKIDGTRFISHETWMLLTFNSFNWTLNILIKYIIIT